MKNLNFVKILLILLPLLTPSLTAALASGTLSITSTSSSLPAATQYQTNYSASPLTAMGGTPPYTWSVTSAGSTLPEGMTLNSTTGVISTPVASDQIGDQTGVQVGGQGGYDFQVQVKDATGLTATAFLIINVTADSTLDGCGMFPADSIFHQRVDSLPTDTSPAAPIPSTYLSTGINADFGSRAISAGPFGIPFIKVPSDQALVNIQWLDYGNQSDPQTSATTNPLTNTIPQYPFPTNAPIQGSANALGQDQHVIALQTAGNGQPCQLYEVWQGTQANTIVDITLFDWTAANGAHWNLGSDALRPLGWTSGDAAGLPILPLTVNYDETCPGGQTSSTSPCSGTIAHPIRFTLSHMLNAMVWPARHSAGTGTCTNSNGTTTSQNPLLSQSTPPVSCTNSAPAGEIYRLMKTVTVNGKSVSTSSLCPASSNPQTSAIITAMEDYGIILADNGGTGSITGTPDARWNTTDLSCLTKIPLSYFQPVNVSTLQVNPNSGATTSLSASLTAVNTSILGTVLLTATASETNGTVAGVVFNTISSNGVSSPITGIEVNTPPLYTMTLINQPAGAAETFSATATDSNNVSVTSSPVTVTVSGPASVITTTAGANGTISPMDPSVAYGASQTFTLSPAAGYQVAQVLVDGNAVSVSNNAFTLSDVTSAHTVSAAFGPAVAVVTYNISLTQPAKGGTISTSAKTVNSGSPVTLTAKAASGYQFSSWGASVSGTTNPLTVDVTENMSVTAAFSATSGKSKRTSYVR